MTTKKNSEYLCNIFVSNIIVVIIKKVRKTMKPTTENPHLSNRCGQTKKSTHTILFLFIIPILFFVLSISDGMAKSTTSMSILSESGTRQSSRSDSGKSDYSIASAGIPSVATVSHSNNTIVSNKGRVDNFKTASITSGPAVSVSPVVTKKSVKKYSFKKTKYVKAASGLNVREKPSKKSKSLATYQFGKKIKCAHYNKNWVIIKYKVRKNGTIKYGYLSKKYLQNKKPKYTVKSVHGDKRKSYMDWRCITSVSSPQYKLQRRAKTASNGIRTVNGRYCVALGSYYTSKIGRYVDLVLANGEVIKCVIGDQKADKDTNSQNAIGNDGSATEFIVSTGSLSHKTRQMGDIGYAHKGWTSKVVKVRLYNKNAFSD